MCGIISLYFPFIFIDYIFSKQAVQNSTACFVTNCSIIKKTYRKPILFYQINCLHRDIFLPYATCDRF